MSGISEPLDGVLQNMCQKIGAVAVISTERQIKKGEKLHVLQERRG